MTRKTTERCLARLEGASRSRKDLIEQKRKDLEFNALSPEERDAHIKILMTRILAGGEETMETRISAATQIALKYGGTTHWIADTLRRIYATESEE